MDKENGIMNSKMTQAQNWSEEEISLIKKFMHRILFALLNAIKLLYVALVLVTILVGLNQSMAVDKKELPSTSKFDIDLDITKLQEMLHERAINRTILISVLDSGFVDMALNLWESSYVRFNITNYLFICLSNNSQTQLAKYNISCFVYAKKFVVDSASSYGEAAYNQKVFFKTHISLQILMLGYDTMIVDLDIVFLENPMPYMQCDTCDLIITDNTRNKLNTGFYLLKSSRIGIALQQKTLEVAKGSVSVHDQFIMNIVIKIYGGWGAVNVKVLDVQKFQPGIVYFDNVDFASQVNNTGVVLVHNNWIVGNRNKIYRFKEMLLWDLDIDGYYSNDTAKYLTYRSPANTPKHIAHQAFTFASCLAKASKRILITPKFACKQKHSRKYKECNYRSFFGQPPLESTVRESEFLHHHKVPESVKVSVSPVINFDKRKHTSNSETYSTVVKLTRTEKDNMELLVKKLNFLGLSCFKVLQFGSLNDVASHFESSRSRISSKGINKI